MQLPPPPLLRQQQHQKQPPQPHPPPLPRRLMTVRSRPPHLVALAKPQPQLQRLTLVFPCPPQLLAEPARRGRHSRSRSQVTL